MTMINRNNLPKKPTTYDMLEHERLWLIREYERLGQLQDGNSEALGGAMGESSETFHDNAPAEVVRDFQNFNVYPRAKEIMRLAAGINVVPYPSLGETRIVLGSIVELVWIEENETEHFAMVGLKMAKIDFLDFPLETITKDSPLGSTLWHTEKGSVVDFENNGIVQKLYISDIDQSGMCTAFNNQLDYLQ